MTDGMTTFRVLGRATLLAALLALAALGGCAGEAGHDDHDHAGAADDAHEGHGEEDGHRAVRIPPEGLEELGIRTATAAAGAIDLRLSLAGEVRLNEDGVAHIVPRTPGIVRDVAKSVGDAVAEGEVLATLESAELGAAKVDYLAARQRLELARTDLERIEAIHGNTAALLERLDREPAIETLRDLPEAGMGENRSRLVGAFSEHLVSRAAFEREERLFERKVTSESEYLEAKSAHEKAHAEYLAVRDSIRFDLHRARLAARREEELAEFAVESAERRLHVLGLHDEGIAALDGRPVDGADLAVYSLRAPFAGTVVDRHITRGEMLEPTESAFTVADLSSVWVDLTVYLKDLARVAPGRTVRIEAAGTEREARIAYVSPLVDEATRTAIARVVLDSPPPELRPGTFVRGVLRERTETASVVVPKSAVQTMDGAPVVFVATDEGFEPRPVRLGREGDAEVEIEEGLRPGDLFVEKGAFVLKAELEKGRFGDGHAH